jgi:hypothetical protein
LVFPRLPLEHHCHCQHTATSQSETTTTSTCGLALIKELGLDLLEIIILGKL